jgi:hypothetical protein
MRASGLDVAAPDDGPASADGDAVAGVEPETAGSAGLGAASTGPGAFTGGAAEGDDELSAPGIAPTGIAVGCAGRRVCEKK